MSTLSPSVLSRPTDEQLTSRLREIASRSIHGIPELEEATERLSNLLAYRLRRTGKTCDKCGVTKALHEFGQNINLEDHLFKQCRSCRSIHRRR